MLDCAVFFCVCVKHVGIIKYTSVSNLTQSSVNKPWKQGSWVIYGLVEPGPQKTTGQTKRVSRNCLVLVSTGHWIDEDLRICLCLSINLSDY